MESSHCIMYTHIWEYRDPRYKTETEGLCIDAFDSNANHLKCADVIAAGHCHRKRTTPLGASP
jgi:hypothetical protein